MSCVSICLHTLFTIARMFLFKGLPGNTENWKYGKADKSWKWEEQARICPAIVANNQKCQISLKLCTSPLYYHIVIQIPINIVFSLYFNHQTSHWPKERCGDTLTPAPAPAPAPSTWNVTVWTRSNNHVSPISQACNYSLHYYSLFQLHCLIKHNLWSDSFHQPVTSEDIRLDMIAGHI